MAYYFNKNMSEERNLKKKIKKWNDIDANAREKMHQLRVNEKKLLNESGYLKWRSSFLTSYLSYAFLLYWTRIRKGTLNNTNIALLFIPTFPLGYALMRAFLNHDKYREYYKNHIELNRLVRMHITGNKY